MGAQHEMEQSAAHCHEGSTEAASVAGECTAMLTEVETLIGRVAARHPTTGGDNVGTHIAAAIEHDKAAQRLGGGFEPSMDAMLHEVELTDLQRQHQDAIIKLGKSVSGLRLATFAYADAVAAFSANSAALEVLSERAKGIAHG